MAKNLLPSWTSRLGFMLATIGAAVGLGNIWKFPYTIANNGGSGFFFIYVIAVVVIGIPAMLAEINIGRSGRANAIDSLRKIAHERGKSPLWQYVGWLCSITLVLILAFYSVVSGWTIAYLTKAVSGQMVNQSTTQINHIWQTFLASPWRLIFWHTIFVIITFAVVARGVQGGIEKASRIMIPLLFLMLIILLIYASQSGGFHQALHFLFSIDAAKINSHVIIVAVGQAFFSLALGAGCILIYGAYLKGESNSTMPVIVIAIASIVVATLAGVAVISFAYASHLKLAEGPGLMFITLPNAFSKMPNGQWLESAFFILLVFAAWTSTISLAEPLVAYLVNHWKMTRHLACIIIGIIVWSLGIIVALSFNVWKNFKLFHAWSLFYTVTYVSTNILLPLGGLFLSLFAGWVLYPRNKNYHDRNFSFRIWLVVIRYIVPIALLLIIFQAVSSAVK